MIVHSVDVSVSCSVVGRARAHALVYVLTHVCACLRCVAHMCAMYGHRVGACVWICWSFYVVRFPSHDMLCAECVHVCTHALLCPWGHLMCSVYLCLPFALHAWLVSLMGFQ